MKHISNFIGFTDIQAQNYLASHLPKGRLTARRFDSTSVLYKLIYCIADWIKQVTSQIYTLAYNRDITQAYELLTEWETSVSIPLIIQRQASVAARRLAVKQLISKIPIVNYQPVGFSGDVKTTVENYVYNLTGLTIHIVFTPSWVAGTMTTSYNNATGLVTCTTTTTNGIGTNAQATISGCSQPVLNGQKIVTVISATQFTYSVASGLGLAPDSGTFIVFFGFPLPFPILFAVPYQQSLFLWHIHVVGVTLPQSTIDLLNIILSRVIPSHSSWDYTLVAI